MIHRYLAPGILLAALSAFLGLTGCGSDEQAEASLTPAQFGKKASLICNRASSEGFKKAGIYVSQHAGGRAGGSEKEMFEQAGTTTFEQALRELQVLPVPSGIEPGIEAYFEEFEAALEEVRKEPLLLAAQPNPFEAARRLAKKYDLGDCGAIP